MSMSQEEIESLMNGLDFEDTKTSESENIEDSSSNENMSEDDINELIAQTEDVSSSEEASTENVDDILNSLENLDVEEKASEETNIDDILKELEQTETSSTPEAVDTTETSDENFDDILAGIEGVQEESSLEVPSSTETETEIETETSKEDGNDNIDHKIDSGVFPLPVEEDTKVVNQLSAVASDSEEKATKIFDVLSNILDYNNAIQNDIQALASFNERQVAMLNSLSQKFPNIEAFAQNLEHAQQMTTHIGNANDSLNNGNTEIFQAMELMQYHDINRQKIERVMSVIRKLSTYLNNLFEDDDNRAEVAVANHIHGDKTDDLVADDDLEALIAEFNN